MPISAATAGTRHMPLAVLLLPCAYGLLLSIGTHLPPAQLTTAMPLPVWDKLLHFLAYAGFALLALSAGRKCLQERNGSLQGDSPVWLLPCVPALLALVALLDEVTQPLTGRHLDLLDWVADLAGIGAAALAFSVLTIEAEDPDEMLRAMMTKEWQLTAAKPVPPLRRAA